MQFNEFIRFTTLTVVTCRVVDKTLADLDFTCGGGRGGGCLCVCGVEGAFWWGGEGEVCVWWEGGGN